MKKILATAALLSCALASFAASQKLVNKYGMTLSIEEGKEPSLTQAERIKTFYGIDAYALEDALVPYTPLKSSMYDGDLKMIQTKDYVYKVCKDGRELYISVDFALDQSEPSPVLFSIHGGSWQAGDRGSFTDMSKTLAKHNGVTGVRIEYSLVNPTNGVMFQDMLEDCRDAVKYVINHAKELNINPKCFGFIGSSAGAHLAAATALSFPKATKVLVGWYGPYDLNLLRTIYPVNAESPLGHAMNGCDEAYMKSVSPQYMIKSPVRFATLLFHGGCDTTVPADCTPNFAKALKEHGAKHVEAVIYPYGTHALFVGIYGEEMTRKTFESFRKYLK